MGLCRRHAEEAVDEALAVKLEDARTDGGKQTEAEALMALGREADLFHSGRETFATFTVNGHKETWPIRSPGFKDWLTLGFMSDRGDKPPSTTALARTLQ